MQQDDPVISQEWRRLEMYPIRCLSVLLAGSLSFSAAESLAGTGPNGAAPRPFYVVAHNPNTLAETRNALRAGANALEPDISAISCGTGHAFDDLVMHDSSLPIPPTSCGQTKLLDWLDGVHGLAIDFPQLAMVVFDIKPSAATAATGNLILDAVRTHLNGHGVGTHYTPQDVQLNVVLSVDTRRHAAVFDAVLPQLGAREGVQFDAEDDAQSVVSYFFGKQFFGNIAYGDGTSGPGPHLPTAIDLAAGRRAASGFPRALTYVYLIDELPSMRLFIDAGVDGIIPPDAELGTLRALVDARSDVRLAVRSDNPFAPALESYALEVSTADDASGGEGTDANITFTLTGTLGSASVTIDTAPTGRMERASVNWVTMQSRNLGALTSVTVASDGEGNKPRWKPREITVFSRRWIGSDMSAHYTAEFNAWLEPRSALRATLVASAGIPDPCDPDRRPSPEHRECVPSPHPSRASATTDLLLQMLLVRPH